jgi:hypothetical protein
MWFKQENYGTSPQNEIRKFSLKTNECAAPDHIAVFFASMFATNAIKIKEGKNNGWCNSK